jgi:large subunit ribosomal protein L37Ae
MSKRKSSKVIGRFGARYGRTVRKRVGQIEAEMKQKHLCQNCGSLKVKRISIGVWNCAKCGFTFSGAAYTPSSRIGNTAKRSLRKV